MFIRDESQYHSYEVILDNMMLFFPSAADTCLKKFKDDEMVFETIQTFKRGEFIHLATKHPVMVVVCLYVYNIDEVIGAGPAPSVFLFQS